MDALLSREFRSNSNNNSFYKIQFTFEEATEARDALAKYLYQRLFEWLVKKINSTLHNEVLQKNCISVNILDIFGFEIFEVNLFYLSTI
jgi:myosin heavy subunit